MNIFGSKSGHLSHIINWKIFLHFLQFFEVFDDFSKCKIAKYAVELGKRIKYSNFGGNEENLAMFTII